MNKEKITIQERVQQLKELICSDTDDWDMSTAFTMIRELGEACALDYRNISQLGWQTHPTLPHSFVSIPEGVLTEAVRQRDDEDRTSEFLTESKVVELLEALWDAGVEVDHQRHSMEALTVLQKVIGEWMPKVVAACIQRGADKHKDPQYSSLIDRALVRGDCDAVGVLLDEGISVNASLNGIGMPPLHQAIWNENTEMIQYLIQKGADLNGLDNKENSPCHIAAAKGSVHILKFLVSLGAQANSINKEGRSPLEEAQRMNKQQMIDYLKGLHLAAEEKNALEQCLVAHQNAKSTDCPASSQDPQSPALTDQRGKGLAKKESANDLAAKEKDARPKKRTTSL